MWFPVRVKRIMPATTPRRFASDFESRRHNLLLGPCDAKRLRMAMPGFHGLFDLLQNLFRICRFESEEWRNLQRQIETQRVVGVGDVEA